MPLALRATAALRPGPGRRLARACAVVSLLLACAAAVPARPAVEAANEARALEDKGEYARAAAALRDLRARVSPDADLEIALALNEARAGDLAGGARRLWGKLLQATLADTLPVERRRDYPHDRQALWTNGRFDGWHWYVTRGRAEVAARQGRWKEALEAARACVAARPLAGKEWLIRAVCAARAGEPAESEAAAEQAVRLDPTLPEARYLAGLHAWRAGRKTAAQTLFREAVSLDSTFAPAALALVRVRLPSTAPDSVPATLLTGVRQIGLLTSPVGPKLEEQAERDAPPAILSHFPVELPDSLRARMQPVELVLPVLVDARGRIALHELPWLPAGAIPVEALPRFLALGEWRFRPSYRHGEPREAWTAILVQYRP